MSDTVPTLRIVAPVTADNPEGFIVINESDFDPDSQARFGVVAKPSDGLTVAQIKESLAAASIAIPVGMTLRSELANLLDTTPAAPAAPAATPAAPPV